ncbi:MAG: 2,3-bisphosphoglycerate-independent phosphoglycerate mutase, partial [Chromatiales bacterium]
MADTRQNLRRPVVLVILDGFGVNPGKLNNAVVNARTPRLDAYFARYSHTLIQASGEAVGLPDGQMGNSEVGHLTLGAGRIIRQNLVKIDDAIADGSFFENPALTAAARAARAAGRPLHLLGLVSDGGVHSHMRHLAATIELCRREGVKPVAHMITDGRDTPPRSAGTFLPELEAGLERAGGSVGSVVGRYYAMDRDRRWDRTELAWRMLTLGKGRRASGPGRAVEMAYEAGETDEFIRPTILPGFTPLTADDHLVFFNFRKDRPRQILAALTQPAFDGFDRGEGPLVSAVGMMEYDASLGLPYAFEPDSAGTTLGAAVSALGLRQFHCAETEKYAHVTYFLNGGRADPYDGEERRLVPSPRVATYDLKPEMSAAEVGDAVIGAIESGGYALIAVNFANGDMVGHTAVPDAVIRAVETLDREAGRVLDAAVAHDCSVVLTADHGNCEELLDPATDMPHTQHTPYPVPCLVVDSLTWQLSNGGGLANVAPTVLELMGVPRPEGMTGRSLLLRPVREVVRPIPDL